MALPVLYLATLVYSTYLPALARLEVDCLGAPVRPGARPLDLEELPAEQHGVGHARRLPVDQLLRAERNIQAAVAGRSVSCCCLKQYGESSDLADSTS